MECCLCGLHRQFKSDIYEVQWLLGCLCRQQAAHENLSKLQSHRYSLLYLNYRYSIIYTEIKSIQPSPMLHSFSKITLSHSLLTYFKLNKNLQTIFDPWKNWVRNESHLSYSGKCQNSRLFSGVICQIAWRADGSCFKATSLLLSAVTGDHQMKNMND